MLDVVTFAARVLTRREHTPIAVADDGGAADLLAEQASWLPTVEDLPADLVACRPEDDGDDLRVTGKPPCCRRRDLRAAGQQPPRRLKPSLEGRQVDGHDDPRRALAVVLRWQLSSVEVVVDDVL